MAAPTVTTENAVTCGICDDQDAAFRWTDTHGVGACLQCGAPYRLYHYEGEAPNRTRVQKPAELLIVPVWVPLVRKCWEETGRNVAPGAFNMPGSSYEVASREDFRIHNEWMQAHESENPEEVGEPS